MAYVPGTNYIGLTALEYQQLQGMGNQQINDFLTANFSTVPGEDFYLFNGDEWEFYILLDQFDFEPGQYGTFFAYLNSTWLVGGI